METPYTVGRKDALYKYAGAAGGALVGGLLGAGLPTVTKSVWERPLRALGGATLGAVLARDPDVDAGPVALNTAVSHFGGAVGGGILGGFTGALLDAKVPGRHRMGSLGTLGGIGVGAALGGSVAGALGARAAEKPAREARQILEAVNAETPSSTTLEAP